MRANQYKAARASVREKRAIVLRLAVNFFNFYVDMVADWCKKVTKLVHTQSSSLFAN